MTAMKAQKPGDFLRTLCLRVDERTLDAMDRLAGQQIENAQFLAELPPDFHSWLPIHQWPSLGG